MPNLPVELDFEVGGHALEGLEALEHGAERLNEKMEHGHELLTELLGLGGALAGAFSLGHMIEATQEHVKEVQRLSLATHQAAGEADALLEVFEAGGVEAGTATMMIQRMSMQALKLQVATEGIAGSAKQVYQQFAVLGVDLRRGVEPSLLKMAERVEKGKINAQQLAMALHIRPGMAIEYMRVLNMGPEKIREIQRELKESGAAIREQDLKNLNAQIQARAEMFASLRRVVIVIGRELTPIVTNLMEMMTARIKGWIEPAKQFGVFLARHLETAIALATILGKILLANAALQKTGLLSAGRNFIVQTATGFAGAAAVGGAAPGAALFQGLAAGAGATFALAGAAWLAVEGLNAIAHNSGGIADYLMETIEGLFTALANIFGGLTDFFKNVTSEGALGMLKSTIPLALSSLVNAITGVVEIIQGTIRWLKTTLDFALGSIPGYGGNAEYVGYGDTLSKLREENERATRARLEAMAQRAKEGKAEINQNFPNARFDITQKFEEGFDPDRILTSFTNDLKALADRGLQSGYAPLYTGRP